MTDDKGNSLSPEPCALSPLGPKAPSMTSGRGWTGSALGTAHVVSASVMDGGIRREGRGA